MSQPFVTVILPAYNHQSFIEESIRGVINQDYKNIEFIILNDGSKDGTHDVISRLVDECKDRFERFEYINKKNEGLAITLNQGVLWSQSDYITVIASDDIMLPYKVSLLLNALINTSENVGLSYGDAEFIDDNSKRIALDKNGHSCDIDRGWQTFISFYTRKRSDIKNIDEAFNYILLLKGNFLPAMSVMWKTTTLKQVGMFTPNIAIEDWDLWLRMAKHTQARYVPRSLALYRWHATNTVKTSVVKLRKSQDTILLKELNDTSNNIQVKKIALKLLFSNSLRLLLAKEYVFAIKRLLMLSLIFFRLSAFNKA